MLSVAILDVSEVPGGWAFNISQKKPPSLTLWAKTGPSRMYWLPMADARFVHLGFSGSSGGLDGLNAVGQKPPRIPPAPGRNNFPSTRPFNRSHYLAAPPFSPH